MSDFTQAVQMLKQIIDLPIDASQGDLDRLIAYLDDLIINDFSAVLSLLYRVDVSEDKVRRKLAQAHHQETAGSILAHLLIERELQKIELRRKFKDGLI